MRDHHYRQKRTMLTTQLARKFVQSCFHRCLLDSVHEQDIYRYLGKAVLQKFAELHTVNHTNEPLASAKLMTSSTSLKLKARINSQESKMGRKLLPEGSSEWIRITTPFEVLTTLPKAAFVTRSCSS
jgi:hypothetical protein